MSIANVNNTRRGQWRIERDDLEAYIQRCYEETQAELQRRTSPD